MRLTWGGNTKSARIFHTPRNSLNCHYTVLLKQSNECYRATYEKYMGNVEKESTKTTIEPSILYEKRNFNENEILSVIMCVSVP